MPVNLCMCTCFQFISKETYILIVIRSSSESYLRLRFLMKQNNMIISNITTTIMLMRIKKSLLFPDDPLPFHRAETSKTNQNNETETSSRVCILYVPNSALSTRR